MTIDNDKVVTETHHFGFGVVAPIYQTRGWLPIPVKGKVVCVRDATGHLGSVTPEKVSDWRSLHPNARGDGSWKGVTEPGSGEAIPDHYMARVVDEDDPKKSNKLDWKNENHSGPNLQANTLPSSFQTLLETIFTNVFKGSQPSRRSNPKIGYQNICQNLGTTEIPNRKAVNEKVANFQGSS